MYHLLGYRMGAGERPQQLPEQPDEQANSHGTGEVSHATAYRREEAQELNHELAQDLQKAAAECRPAAAVAPAALPEQDDLASRECSSFGRAW